MAFEDRPYVLLVGGTSLSTGRLSGAWVTKLWQALRQRCRRQVRVIDAGKGSQTSDWAITQLDWWKTYRADAVLLEFAINDAATGLFPAGLAGHQSNMYTVIDSLRLGNAGLSVILQTMSPLGPSGATARPNMAGFYQSDRDIATAKSARLVDHNPAWITAAGGTPPNQYVLPNDGTWTQGNDELHPTEARVEQILLPRLIAYFAALIDDTVEFVGYPTDGAKNAAYSWTPPAAFGGTGPYTYTIDSGALPPGWSINASTGAITGTTSSAGKFTFAIKIADLSGKSSIKQCSVSVLDLPAFRSMTVQTGTSGLITKPAGVAVGDLVFVLQPYDNSPNLTTTGGSAWNKLNYNWFGGSYNMTLYWKILDATDVANAWNLSGNSYGWVCVSYERGTGCTVAVRETREGSTALLIPFAGFTPQATFKMALYFVVDRGTGTFTPPAGWTERVDSSIGGGVFSESVAERFDYTGGGVNVTNSSGSYNDGGFMVEVY